MKRRAYLSALTATTVGIAGCTAVGAPTNESQPGYHREADVVYEREKLDLQLHDSPVRLGDTVEFRVTNTSASEVGLGCKNPWAIQQYSGDAWQHVTWTDDRFYRACLTVLRPGESLAERLTLSGAELEKRAAEMEGELTPGRYRFLLLGTSPYLALEYDIMDS